MVDAYYFCIGGSVGEFASIGRPVGYRCAATDVPDAIERLMNQFTNDHKPGENLRQFFARHTNDDLRSILAGGFAAASQARCRCRRCRRGTHRNRQAKWARFISSARAQATQSCLRSRRRVCSSEPRSCFHDSLVSREVLAMIPGDRRDHRRRQARRTEVAYARRDQLFARLVCK